MFGKKQKEIERLSERCFELGEKLREKNIENKKLKETIRSNTISHIKNI